MSSTVIQNTTTKPLKNRELKIIDKIRRRAASASSSRVRLGIGDDAAVLPPLGAQQELLVTTDLVVEGSHFERHRHPARALGHKVMARGLSDIAAMGGKPLYALLSLCLPGWAGQKWQKQFFAGLFRLAEAYDVRVVGGDLSAGQQFAADIIILGAARRGRALERGKARVGDIIYVSGRLGGSALGLERLLSDRFGPGDAAVRRHLYPTPRLALGLYLSGKLKARAAMDLSDGLSIDLFRLAAESGVGAEVHRAEIPVFPGATLEQGLHGGEDYELLFTLDPRRKAPASFEGIPLAPIGRITASRRLMLVDGAGRKTPMPIKGFQHRL